MNINETTSRYWNLDNESVWNSFVTEIESNQSGVATDTPQCISPLVSSHILRLLRLFIDLSLTNVVSLFGCCSNIVNIVVYLNMGLADTTINILALSALDLLACAATLICVISISPFTAGWTLPSGAPLSELAFVAFIVYYLSVTCSAWVTTLLSVERCLCIAVPLKVKTMVTAKRTILLIAAMVVYQLVFLCLMYIHTGPPYTPSNSSMDRKVYLFYSYSIPSTLCFAVIFTSTIFLVYTLKSHRNEAMLKAVIGPSSTNTAVANRTAKKERKAIRFVFVICSLFLVCFAPNTITFLVTVLIVPELELYDAYLGSLLNLIFMLCTLFQTVSSSVNIFVYYSLNSNFRAVFKRFFCGRKSDP